MKLICASCGARFEFEAEGADSGARCPSCRSEQVGPVADAEEVVPRAEAAVELEEWAAGQQPFALPGTSPEAPRRRARRPLIWVALAVAIGVAAAWAVPKCAGSRADDTRDGDEVAAVAGLVALTRAEAEGVVARAGYGAAAHANGAGAGADVARTLRDAASEFASAASTRTSTGAGGHVRRDRRNGESARVSSSRLVALTPPPVAEGPVVAEASAELFAEGLRTFVQDSVARCRHRHETDEGPLPQPRVELTIDVGPDGRVVDISSGRDLDDTAFGRCIATHGRRWRFPAFDGNVVTLRKTFVVQ
jgi:hypothetical protein